MNKENRFFDDIARVAGGALGALSGVREEAEVLIRGRVERLLVDMDLVPRDEFEAVKAIAVAAQAEVARLSARLDALENAPARAKPAAAASGAGVTRRRPPHRAPGAVVKKATPRKSAPDTDSTPQPEGTLPLAPVPAPETPAET